MHLLPLVKAINNQIRYCIVCLTQPRLSEHQSTIFRRIDSTRGLHYHWRDSRSEFPILQVRGKRIFCDFLYTHKYKVFWQPDTLERSHITYANGHLHTRLPKLAWQGSTNQ